MDVDELLDNPKSLTRYRVLRSTRPLLAERGLSVSMDDIAEATGVSRRSLFRHFDSRNALIADALESSIELFDGEFQSALGADGDLREWLEALTRRLLTVQRRAGAAFWQLASAADEELPAEFAAINERRRGNRLVLTEVVSDAAWRRAGGRTPCPTVVADAVALTFSTFATHSLLDDYECTLERVVEVTVTVLTAVINDQLDGRRRSSTKPSRSQSSEAGSSNSRSSSSSGG
jgi:AcrR family transcriptional regulator